MVGVQGYRQSFCEMGGEKANWKKGGTSANGRSRREGRWAQRTYRMVEGQHNVSKGSTGRPNVNPSNWACVDSESCESSTTESSACSARNSESTWPGKRRVRIHHERRRTRMASGVRCSCRQHSQRSAGKAVGSFGWRARSSRGRGRRGGGESPRLVIKHSVSQLNQQFKREKHSPPCAPRRCSGFFWRRPVKIRLASPVMCDGNVSSSVTTGTPQQSAMMLTVKRLTKGTDFVGTSEVSNGGEAHCQWPIQERENRR